MFNRDVNPNMFYLPKPLQINDGNPFQSAYSINFSRNPILLPREFGKMDLPNLRKLPSDLGQQDPYERDEKKVRPFENSPKTRPEQRQRLRSSEDNGASQRIRKSSESGTLLDMTKTDALKHKIIAVESIDEEEFKNIIPSQVQRQLKTADNEELLEKLNINDKLFTKDGKTLEQIQEEKTNEFMMKAFETELKRIDKFSEKLGDDLAQAGQQTTKLENETVQLHTDLQKLVLERKANEYLRRIDEAIDEDLEKPELRESLKNFFADNEKMYGDIDELLKQNGYVPGVGIAEEEERPRQVIVSQRTVQRVSQQITPTVTNRRPVSYTHLTLPTIYSV
eukprot:TRINITY_DN1901_c0_g2_i4.p1 TRINITY_DN1901_c0_g2~~TRINITY_DN1901_c0_g2_i4.p1  ORF type:complete len:337 (-),score=80.15 TRINITY_DN1901_c0_g2_i4:35-1045(-)